MPIPKGSSRQWIVNNIRSGVAAYNEAPRGPRYNREYSSFIEKRKAGVAAVGSLAGWILTQDAAECIHQLMADFGMNKLGSKLVYPSTFASNLSMIPEKVDIAGLSSIFVATGPLSDALGNSTVAKELTKLFNFCSGRGRFSKAGGFVIGSKVAHAMLPELCPMIDRAHIAPSLHNVASEQYLPPNDNWDTYLGLSVIRLRNPSSQGGGGYSWKHEQFLCALGFYARIYQDWQDANGNPGLHKFLAQDSEPGTTGVPRLLDKVLW